jgi:UbiD family decarboxylase
VSLQYLRSLREYIDALRAVGEILDVDGEVDGPGSQPGFRVFRAPAGVSRRPDLYLSRVGLSIGLGPHATGREIIEALVAARDRAPIPPRRVASGPCQTHAMSDVDVMRFPAPQATVVAQTPDGLWTNWGIARVMLVDARRLTAVVHPLQHLGMIYGMWKKIGKPMPFAMFQGGPPFIPFVSGMPLPAGTSEADYMGGYFGEPVDVVQCQTVDLDVPAESEIVVEGYLSDTEMTGPMFHVTAVTYRDDPILTVVASGDPIEESHSARGIPSAAELLVELRAAGLPVTLAWMPLERANRWLVVTVPRDWRARVGCSAEDLCRRIGAQVFESSKFRAVIPKIIVLSDDIDATSTPEVLWGFATRCHPSSGDIAFPSKSNKVVHNCLP